MAKLARQAARPETPQDRREIQGEARRVARDHPRLSAPPTRRGKRRARKLQKLPRDASPGAPAQPLRADRPPARRVPQVRSRAQQAARPRAARRGARRDQGELVEMRVGEPHEHERPDRRHADPHPQCADGRPHGGGDARLEAEERHRPGAEGRGLHRGLRACATRQDAQEGARHRPQVLRRPAGDRAPRARVEAGPARLQGPRRHPARDERPRRGDPLDLARRDDRPQGARRRASAAKCSASWPKEASTMSRIAKYPVPLPKGVEVNIASGRSPSKARSAPSRAPPIRMSR